MITYCKGKILEAQVQAIVNPVNTVGVMGKGLALAFKEKYPDNYRLYAAACRRGEMLIGQVFPTNTGRLDGPRWVINFPTKQHWKDKSKLAWIVQGLDDLGFMVKSYDILSIAIPALGCGLGGLDWNDVKPAIEFQFKNMPGVDVLVYEPAEVAL